MINNLFMFLTHLLSNKSCLYVKLVKYLLDVFYVNCVSRFTIWVVSRVRSQLFYKLRGLKGWRWSKMSTPLNSNLSKSVGHPHDVGLFTLLTLSDLHSSVISIELLPLFWEYWYNWSLLLIRLVNSLCPS